MEDWSLKSPMPGTVLEVLVNVGDEVEQGTVLVIVEAVKMENELEAQCGGIVKEVKVKEGDFVNLGEELVVVTQKS